ncbi:MAG TPA: hypothetical protein DCE41_19005, partial [Cytophagales bacterium]|nr:hypothetical protein [Cytophagales bacterium]
MPQDLPSVSGFPYDIFISYAHNDNQQVNEEIKGWVELFYNSLEMTLRQRLGKKRNVKIWWDQRRLKANTKFDHSIAEGVEQAAIMICLNSQSLIDSDYCQLERAAFVKKSEEDPVPLVLDHQSRMIPVHLYRLHFEDWPEEFDGLTGLPIYEPDRGGMSYPMLPRDTKFIYRIRDLAEETVTILENIATLTETLQGSTEKQDLAEEVAVVETTEDHRGTLFIGEESRALRQTKIQLIEALRKRGYTILPKEPLPFERIAHETAVRECLAKADASIHLMGRKPGEPFDEDDQVFPNLEQIRWAQEANLQPLVWLPDGLTLDQVSPLSYQTFLRQLEQGSALSRSYRLEWAPPEELVSLIDDHFAELKASRQFKGKVLVDLHAKDQPEVLDLLKWMDVQGIDYWLNPVEEEPGKRLALLEEAVSKVGQLIFICGYAQKAWVESRLQAVCQLIIEQNLAPKDLKVLILPPEKTKEAYDFSDWHFLNLEVVDHSTSQELQPTILEQLKIKSSSIPVRNSVEQAPKNPYVGLRPFDEEDSLYFFGRRQQIIELLDRLYQHRFLAVVGASGSGKSSLIRAGLIPLLRAGYLAYGNQGWEIATLKPGQNPRRNLVKAIADSLQSLAEAPTLEQLELDLERDGVKALIDPLRTLMETQEVNFFLLVDQFEELFRFAPEQAGEEQAHQNAEAQLFISLLLDLAQTPELPLFVTITMRSDFLGDCARYIRLTKVLNASQYLVPRLSAVQRQQAIPGPARLSGTPLDAALTETLLEENPSNQDQLPVLQHALNRMWVQVMREGMARPIGVEEYERVGGLENALSLHLDELMAGLPDDDVQLTLRLFQLLTSADKAGRRTRRPARRRELATQLGQTPEGVNRLLKPFMPDDPKREQAFVLAYPVADDPTDVLLDISHESLIRQWKTLESFSAVNTNQAEAAFQRLPDEDKPLAAALFRALVEQDPDGLHYRVRPTQVQQLAAIMDQAESTVNRLIDYFIQAQNNLLFRTEIPSEPDNPRIELGGDEVILAWPLLKQWAEKEVELQGRYWELLQQAEAHDRGEAGLLQQPYLALVDVWVNKYSANAAWANRIAPGWERAYNYLEDSLAAEAAQQEEIKRLRRRQLASLGVLAAIVTIAAVVAFILMGQARDETARAEASEQKSETITNAFRLLSQAENELQETANVGLFLAKVALDSINKDTTDENATNLRSLQRGVYDLVENSLFFSSPFLQDTLTYYATAHQWDLGFRQGKSGVLRNRASKTRQGIGFPFTDEEYIDQVFVAPNGSSFVVTFWDHAPQWRDSTGALLGELNINDSLDVKDVVFSQDSDWVMIGTAKRLWRCNRGQEADFFAYLGGSWFGELSRLALHPEERFIATASTSGYVGVWSMSSQRLQVSIPRDERVSGEVMALRFSEAGTHLLVGGQAG